MALGEGAGSSLAHGGEVQPYPCAGSQCLPWDKTLPRLACKASSHTSGPCPPTVLPSPPGALVPLTKPFPVSPESSVPPSHESALLSRLHLMPVLAAWCRVARVSQSLLAQAAAGGGFLFPLKPGELKRKNPPVLGDPSRPGWLLPQAGALRPCQKVAQVAGSVGSPH